ncbi:MULTISPECIES: hypothetical protein [Nitrospirillum]|uniref:Tetratricopeptide repeat protein n=1 Tax=Nitrospirillum amazonense TaxID=28077 RepID=A0A560GA82_9PROT|nr:hypothetical protein [Nitrospirillum amazonense]MEC4590636.1 hypothetical protein [Nitrospirillum amazonense]TWB30815.1 hypothetical protein FBZ88_102380 [Nitrospirillum amazonense]
MTTRLRWLAAFTAVMMAGGAHAADAPPAAGTPAGTPAARADRLAQADAARQRQTPADVKAARALTAQGDRAYRRGEYGKAYAAYSSAYPNSPLAYAYVMASDAHWRAVVQAHAAARKKGGKRCDQVGSDRLAGDLAQSLEQELDFGLALAAHDKDRLFLDSPLAIRAGGIATCLRDLTQRLRAGAPRCDDTRAIEHCLGEPLPVGGG